MTVRSDVCSMLTVTRKELWPGVGLTAVHTTKFKNGVLGVRLLTPLRRETAALNALLPMVLRRGTRLHPDMESISAALDELYGAWIEPAVDKEGETQCVGFLAGVLDDAYTLGGEAVLEPAAALVGELLLDPAVVNGAFDPEYTAGERRNLIDQIRAVINDKRQYSLRRLTEEMCPDEAFGVSGLGDEASAAAITPESLWQHYQQLLRTARVELFYCGSAPVQRVEAAFAAALSALPRGEREAAPACEVRAAPAGPVRTVEEAMEVTQGKLALGFRTGGVTVRSEEYPAMLLFTELYGGSPTSRLFLNVREKLSLCYFASAGLSQVKGVILVSSGIEFDKYQQAREEILAQLEAVRQGAFEDWELEAARSGLISSLKSRLDSNGLMERYWRLQSVAGTQVAPEELARKLESVTREQVIQASRQVSLDTVYFLKGAQG